MENEIPFRAYEGNDPFIFISYSHADMDLVFPEIRRMHDEGYRIWYDQGIKPSEEWMKEIVKAINKSIFFVLFVSPAIVDSIYVKMEISWALKNRKPFLAIFLNDTKLPDEISFQIDMFQHLFKYKVPEAFYREGIAKALPKEAIAVAKPKEPIAAKVLPPVSKIEQPKFKISFSPLKLEISFQPCDIKDQFIFAGYSDNDKKDVYPELNRLHDFGYRIWYDKRTVSNEPSALQIAEGIEKCSLFLVFVSQASVESAYILQEISYAIEANKKFLAVFLHETTLPTDLKALFKDRQQIFKYKIPEQEYGEKLRLLLPPETRLTSIAFPPCDMRDPFIFASYGDEDRNQAYPVLNRLHDSGYQIWYDAGKSSKEQPRKLVEAIERCSFFLVFVSPAVSASEQIKQDILQAINKKKKILTVFLDNTTLPRDLELSIGKNQHVFKHLLPEHEFLDKLRAMIPVETRLTIVSFSPCDLLNPFIFTCYASADKRRVYPELNRLHNVGYRIWYDDEVPENRASVTEIADAIERCAVFLLFISPASVASKYVNREIAFAVEVKKRVIAVFLHDTTMPKDLELSLKAAQHLLKYAIPEQEYAEKLREMLPAETRSSAITR
nr:toll/interleukin-1 receptor domain-containing protein [Candidatus Sigynarchaeota archaeon]